MHRQPHPPHRSAAGLAALVLALVLAGCGRGPDEPEAVGAVEPEAPSSEQAASPGGSSEPAKPTARSPVDPAAADAELVERLRRMLSAYEYSPDRDDLLRLGSEEAVTGALVAIYDAGDEALFRRSRALSALQHLPGPDARSVFRHALEDPQIPGALRRAAIRAHGWAFGSGAFSDIAPLLEHDDPHTRTMAARTLVRIAPERARPMVQRRLAVEPRESVRLPMQRLLQQSR